MRLWVVTAYDPSANCHRAEWVVLAESVEAAHALLADQEGIDGAEWQEHLLSVNGIVAENRDDY